MYRCFLKSCKNYTFKPSHNILTLFNNLAQVRIATSKTIPNVHNNKLATRVASRVPNELRLKILKNQEILEKCQIWVDTQPSAQSSFQKLNFDNSCQNQITNSCPILLNFFTLCQIFWPGLLVKELQLREQETILKLLELSEDAV